MKLDKLGLVSERDVTEYLIGLESLSEWLFYYTIVPLYVFFVAPPTAHLTTLNTSPSGNESKYKVWI